MNIVARHHSTWRRSPARVYRRDVAELLSAQPLADDPFTVRGQIADNVTPEWNAEVGHSIELLKEAIRLEGFLGDRARPFPPACRFAEPLTWGDAIEQGKDLAVQERRRLGLGSAAITDVVDVIASQGIWTCAMPVVCGKAIVPAESTSISCRAVVLSL